MTIVFSEDSVTTAAPPTSCASDWVTEGGSCFKVMSLLKTFNDADAYCQAEGGHLAEVDTTSKQSVIKGLIDIAETGDNLCILVFCF